MSSKVLELATSFDGTKFAVGIFDDSCAQRQTVEVWDVTTLKRVSRFEAMLDFGGQRLAVTHDGLQCVAGAYERYGIGCYEVTSGKEVWRRKDLKKVQWVGVSVDNRKVYCALEGRPCFVLDRKTGGEIGRYVGTRCFWESAYGPWVFLDKAKPELRTVEGKQIALVERETFGILTAWFSPERLYISECGGPLRCFEVETGQERWRYVPLGGNHVLDISYATEAKQLVAMEWAYQRGGPYKLLAFSEDSAEPRVVGVVDACREVRFSNKGNNLLTSDGMLIDTGTGKTVQRFSFGFGMNKH